MLPPLEAEYRARHADGHWVWMSNRGKVVQFSQDGKPLRMVGTLMDISKRKQVEGELLATQAQLQTTLQEIEQLAFHDTLTSLPNRRLLVDRMETALAASQRNHRHGAVLFLDLDKFKYLNDSHGHEVGDLVLQEVARRLQQCVRAIDTVARLGGDEFVVLLQDLSAQADDARLHTSAVGHQDSGQPERTLPIARYRAHHHPQHWSHPVPGGRRGRVRTDTARRRSHV